jgi:hypothetical protein
MKKNRKIAKSQNRKVAVAANPISVIIFPVRGGNEFIKRPTKVNFEII